MKIRRPNLRLIAMTLSLSAPFGLASQVHAYDVYRGVNADPATGAVAWNVGSFGVGGVPPTLSFFHFANDGAAQAGLGRQCLVKVNLPHTPAVPVPLAIDTVGTLPIPVNGAVADQPLAFPWTIVFDNVPPNHWSIPKAQITAAASNNAAGRVAAAGFHSLATTPASGVTVINGTLANCRA